MDTDPGAASRIHKSVDYWAKHIVDQVKNMTGGRVLVSHLSFLAEQLAATCILCYTYTSSLSLPLPSPFPLPPLFLLLSSPFPLSPPSPPLPLPSLTLQPPPPPSPSSSEPPQLVLPYLRDVLSPQQALFPTQSMNPSILTQCRVPQSMIGLTSLRLV